MLKDIRAIVYKTCSYRDSYDCPFDNPACRECARKINEIISVIADDIERIGIIPKHVQALHYVNGARDEHAYIVEYLRGLLDN